MSHERGDIRLAVVWYGSWERADIGLGEVMPIMGHDYERADVRLREVWYGS